MPEVHLEFPVVLGPSGPVLGDDTTTTPLVDAERHHEISQQADKSRSDKTDAIHDKGTTGSRTIDHNRPRVARSIDPNLGACSQTIEHLSPRKPKHPNVASTCNSLDRRKDNILSGVLCHPGLPRPSPGRGATVVGHAPRPALQRVDSKSHARVASKTSGKTAKKSRLAEHAAGRIDSVVTEPQRGPPDANKRPHERPQSAKVPALGVGVSGGTRANSGTGLGTMVLIAFLVLLGGVSVTSEVNVLLRESRNRKPLPPQKAKSNQYDTPMPPIRELSACEIEPEATFVPIHTHRNEGCPSTAEMFQAFEKCFGINKDLLPLHLKEVPFVNLDRIEAFAAGAGAVWLEHWLKLRRYLEDPSVYAEEAEKHAHTDNDMCRYKEEEVQLQAERSFIVRWAGRILGKVRQFPVPEFLKFRRRGISHTVTANHTGRMGSCQLPTLGDKFRILHEGSHAVAFDFSQCFSAYEYAEKVRGFFCFHSKKGDVYALRRLAMGQTHACDIAQFVLCLVLHSVEQEHKIKSMGHIDNGLMVGSESELIAAVETLKSICAVIGITLNDPHLLVPLRIVDYCGLNLNFATKQLKVGSKTSSKIEFVTKQWDKIVEQTTSGHESILDRTLDETCGANSIMVRTRALAVVFGLLQYYHSVQRCGGLLGAAGHYGTCRYMASVSRAAQADPNLWKGEVAVPLGVLHDVQKWLGEATQNPYVSYMENTTMPTKTVYTDACGTGWAVVVVDHTKGDKHVVLTGAFPTQINTVLSTQTEPWAIVFGMKEALTKGLILPGEKVHIVNDHLPFLQAAKKGFSPNWHYNMCISEIRKLPVISVFTYIPGELNPADDPSRGGNLSLVLLGRALVEYGYGVDLPLLYTTPSFKKSKEPFNSCNKQQSESRAYSLSWLGLD
jgi:hypothetical protein